MLSDIHKLPAPALQSFQANRPRRPLRAAGSKTSPWCCPQGEAGLAHSSQPQPPCRCQARRPLRHTGKAAARFTPWHWELDGGVHRSLGLFGVLAACPQPLQHRVTHYSTDGTRCEQSLCSPAPQSLLPPALRCHRGDHLPRSAQWRHVAPGSCPPWQWEACSQPLPVAMETSSRAPHQALSILLIPWEIYGRDPISVKELNPIH